MGRTTWKRVEDPQCVGCRYYGSAGGVGVCDYWKIKGHSRLSLHGYQLPLPEKCQEREGRRRGDICERCQRQKKRAKRSGSGRQAASKAKTLPGTTTGESKKESRNE